MIKNIAGSILARKDALAERISYLYLMAFRSSLRRSLSIPSHITTRERVALNRLARGRRVVVEIGSYLGASALALAADNASSGMRLYCVDTWENDAMSEGKRDTFADFEKNTRQYRESIVALRGFSQEQARILASRERNIDLLFIDGDHSYEGALGDWESYSGMLRTGSIVAFHDYGWAPGVRRVVIDNVLPQITTSDQLPNMWWGVIA